MKFNSSLNRAIKDAWIYKKSVGFFDISVIKQNESFEYAREKLNGFILCLNKKDGIIKLKSGGTIEFWTLRNSSAGRSRSYDSCYIQSLHRFDVSDNIDLCIIPSLIDKNGICYISNHPMNIPKIVWRSNNG